ncbi:divergent PAP2 family protein [Candidatus Saccharibacteria bacterium]|nr:divergent PAP2 family protein [Candidatus Saccharibacteria bacterium]
MEVLGSFIAFVVGWLLAQLGKLLGAIIKGRGKLKPSEALRNFTRSGGMPSGHAASLGALVTYLGFWQGFDSAVFALGVGVALIVFYDAMNVRYAVGEMGKVLNELTEKKMKVREGHTLPQVMVGALLGVAIGTGIFLLMH